MHITRSLDQPLTTLDQQARVYDQHSRSENTTRAYQQDWWHFTTWCGAYHAEALPATPDTIRRYIADLATSYTVATIERRLVAISQAHQLAGHESPTTREAVRTTMKGIRRTLGTAQNHKAPATTDVLKLLVDTLDLDEVIGFRDRALLLVGFAGAFRRSELVSLDVEDLAFSKQGVVITLRRSKTDQEGQGQRKAIPYGLYPSTCPVQALECWLKEANLTTGAIFRPIDRHGNVKGARLTGHAVAHIVKRCALAAGLDPNQFSGHSLRAGLATSAAAAGVAERQIMKQTGHKSVNMVRRYIREGELFRDNAAGQVGL